MSKPSLLEQLGRKKSLAQIQRELDERESGSLVKSLTLLDLTCFGIAAVIGAGIFSTIGTASFDGGPAISILFVITAIACLFSALCYAEFASKIPVSGSAYTYSFAAFGEFVAWIIGWNLLMEYAIGNSVLAFAWSEYFMNLVEGVGLQLPSWLCHDYYSCAEAASEMRKLAESGGTPNESIQRLFGVWESAPNWLGVRCIVDVPALLINVIMTTLVYIGIHESKMVSNAMVFLKLGVILLVIVVGIRYVQPENWSPFAPNGLEGVFKGIAAVFFAYIGFDAISTTAEECRNAQRDIPRATI
nr:amino acid permease [Pirellula sp.]